MHIHTKKFYGLIMLSVILLLAACSSNQPQANDDTNVSEEKTETSATLTLENDGVDAEEFEELMAQLEGGRLNVLSQHRFH